MEILEVKQIHKIYGEKGNKVYALRNVSFSVEQGEFIAIVGTSGSGKSTLLNLIGGLDVPSQGQIIIRGHNIASLKRKELTIFRRRNIGFVFQKYSLMPVLNVYDNVALPVTFDRGKHVDHGYIRELLRELGLLKESSRKYNQTILMVTHNEALAQACDRIIRIEDGKLYRSGKTATAETDETTAAAALYGTEGLNGTDDLSAARTGKGGERL